MATMVAVDLGAQSGRVAVGRYDGRRLTVEEVHRFPNVPVRTQGRLQWDVLRLYADVLDGLRAAGLRSVTVSSSAATRPGATSHSTRTSASCSAGMASS